MELVELWDSKKVCDYLNVTPNNLHQLRYRKQLVYVEKHGRRSFYHPEDVIAFKLARDGKNS
mgnify:CR=1 FL=1